MIGQNCARLMSGVVNRGDVADATDFAKFVEQASFPVTVTWLMTEQASMGAVKLSEKFVVIPGAKEATESTVLGEA